MSSEPAQSSGMMPIRITYRDSADHVLEGMEQVPTPRPMQAAYYRWIAIIAAITVLLCVRTMLTSGGVDWGGLLWSLFAVLVFAAFVAFLFQFVRGRGAIWRKWYRHFYRQRTGREHSQVVCEFGDAALFVSAEGGVATHFPWTAIARVIERPKGLLVYSAPEDFYWFPKTVFASESAYATVVALLRSKVANFETTV